MLTHLHKPICIKAAKELFVWSELTEVPTVTSGLSQLM